MKLRTEGYFGNEKFKPDNHYLLIIDKLDILSSMAIFMRGFFTLRVVTPLRPLIKMIKEVIKDLGPFTTILFTMSTFFATWNYTLWKMNLKKGLTDEKVSFEDCMKD